ncbi:hypothetical protein FB45DRAFT_805772 [Roridomyces roridus]|uniref:Uncharacterized protein n=1 Tax=Roridomyces roridus TaxID=1738132 RepID=A0AAD7B2Q4_9AGAR|nr:hypothetical protein FB45DRAFT_373639 [Roridomyces roridus]KAJ7609105.1 hypothetical protein FB45DRAFT_805772 [Roridomyces roridus]
MPSSSPSWPSLYSPGVEIVHIEHNDPEQPTGVYLSHPVDVFRFTLYWTLIFYTPIFLFCGVYAFLNLTFPPNPRTSVLREASDESAYPLLTIPYSPREADTPLLRPPKRKPNEGRSRTTFALLVLLTFIALSLLGAAIGSAIVGFVLALIYRLAKYNLSTWVPFIWSVIYVLVGLLSVWPFAIDII